MGSSGVVVRDVDAECPASRNLAVGLVSGSSWRELHVARPSVFSVEDKYRLVLAVISGEMSTAEAARRGKASEQSISTWKRQFLEGGKAGLAANASLRPSQRERALADENEELKAALGEAHVELRVWKRSAEHRLGPTRTSR